MFKENSGPEDFVRVRLCGTGWGCRVLGRSVMTTVARDDAQHCTECDNHSDDKAAAATSQPPDAR